MNPESPCILVDLPYCYLPFDHPVRKMERKIAESEKQRERCREARKNFNPPTHPVIRLLREAGLGVGG